MKNDSNGLASDIKFRSSEELFKDTFRHFRDGMDSVASKLLLAHNKRDTNEHREDMAILYDNVPILDCDRFSEYLRYYECDKKPLYKMACSCDYQYLYNKISDLFERINENETESESNIYNFIEHLIFIKNIANFKMAIESIGIRGEDYVDIKFVPDPES